MKYVIAWKVRATGSCGEGKAAWSEEFGREIVETMNRQWAGTVDHWLKPVDDKKDAP